MDEILTIRRERAADQPAVFEVNRLAFPTDLEARLVDGLRAGGHVQLTLVAEREGRIVGHVLFSTVCIDDGVLRRPALALAPVAVIPSLQRQGIGSALIHRGLEELRTAGHAIVLVLGEPAFYRRFGFQIALAAGLRTPFPPEYFMALELQPGALFGISGKVVYPPPLGLDQPPT